MGMYVAERLMRKPKDNTPRFAYYDNHNGYTVMYCRPRMLWFLNRMIDKGWVRKKGRKYQITRLGRKIAVNRNA